MQESLYIYSKAFSRLTWPKLSSFVGAEAFLWKQTSYHRLVWRWLFCGSSRWWLLFFPKKSIHKIILKSFISIAIKSTCRVTLLMVIDVSFKRNSENKISLEANAVLNYLRVLSLLSLMLSVNLDEINECMAQELNIVSTSLVASKVWPTTTLEVMVIVSTLV